MYICGLEGDQCTGPRDLPLMHVLMHWNAFPEMEVTSLGSFWYYPVDLVRIWDVQLASLHQFIEVIAFVQGTAEPGLPRWRVWFVQAFSVLAFEQSPSLQTTRAAWRWEEMKSEHAILFVNKCANNALKYISVQCVWLTELSLLLCVQQQNVNLLLTCNGLSLLNTTRLLLIIYHTVANMI